MAYTEKRQNTLVKQYKVIDNLGSRIKLHERFSTNSYDWHYWVFDQFGFLPAESCILELGCGSGELWTKNRKQLSDKKWRIFVSDFSLGMARHIQKLCFGNFISGFLACNAQNIPIRNDCLNAVIANHMLYHVPDKVKLFSEIRRVLKPGGYLFATTNGQNHLKELRELVKLFCPKVKFGQKELASTATFNLENGASQLAKWFSQVNILRFQNSLYVTETEPLIAYICSCLDARPTKKQLENLSKFVQQSIQKDSAIKITKDSGMFIAVKAVK